MEEKHDEKVKRETKKSRITRRKMEDGKARKKTQEKDRNERRIVR